MQAAIALDTRNPLARFELANVLMVQERLEEALQQLQELAVSTAEVEPSCVPASCICQWLEQGGVTQHSSQQATPGGQYFVGLSAKPLDGVFGSVHQCSR